MGKVNAKVNVKYLNRVINIGLCLKVDLFINIVK